MNNYSPEGQELLQGLYIVKGYLDKANEKFNEFWKLERQYRRNFRHIAHNKKIEHIEKIGLTSSGDKFLYSLYVAGITFSVINSLISLLTGNIINLIFCLLVTVLFIKGRIKSNKKHLVIGGIVLAFMVLDFIRNQIRQTYFFIKVGNYSAIALGVVAILLAVIIGSIISRKLLKKYNFHIDTKNQKIDVQNLDIDKENKKIDEKNKQIDKENEKIAEYNREIDLKRQEISAEINAIHKEMLDRTEAWFPPDYYSLDAVEEFISYVRNHRADTVKEMMSVFDTTNYRKESLRNQQEINEKLSQSINNQEQMMEYQRQANTLLVGNMIANIATSINTGEIARNTRETARNTREAASHSATIAREAQAMSRRIGADRYNSF